MMLFYAEGGVGNQLVIKWDTLSNMAQNGQYAQ
jgi:hypothetical protein